MRQEWRERLQDSGVLCGHGAAGLARDCQAHVGNREYPELSERGTRRGGSKINHSASGPRASSIRHQDKMDVRGMSSPAYYSASPTFLSEVFGASHCQRWDTQLAGPWV